LGSHACQFYKDLNYEVVSIYKHHKPLNNSRNSYSIDILNLELVKNFLYEQKPDIILNCSGLTSVEQCEANQELANFLHVLFPTELAKFTAQESIGNIHISTDHLWDGLKQFYSEEDPVNPINIYGETKARGEKEVVKTNPLSLILRTNFFGSGSEWRQSFSDWVISKLNKKQEFFGFEDIYYTPISVGYLLKFMNELFEIRYSGIIHVAGSERISKYEFILKMANQLNLNHSHCNKVKYSDVQQSVIRPMDMSLNTNRLSNVLNTNIPDVVSSLRRII
jgi:dTDP-4-dehydrorhamnose reductase